MKLNIYTKVSLNIIIIFVIIMAAPLIPDSYPNLFGDWYCDGFIKTTGLYCDYANNNWQHRHIPTWHWGYRHWIFSFMGFALFITQAIRIGYIIDKHNSK